MKLYDISQEIFSCAVYPGDPEPEKIRFPRALPDIWGRSNWRIFSEFFRRILSEEIYLFELRH